MKKSDKRSLATANLLASFTAAGSRRNLLKGVATGAAALGASALTVLPVQAAQLSERAAYMQRRANVTSAATILTVARTAEQLAVTFYSNGIANADKLNITGDNLEYLKAALVEEQIHQQFFTAAGGKSLADTFSFPQGPATFTDLKTFIATQQQLEGVFDSAFLAAIAEFAVLGRPDLAQISGQIATIESEHRALGRAIGGLVPADNWAFTPVFLAAVGDAPALVQKAGYLSPVSGNSYMYKEVSIDDPGVVQRKPFSAGVASVGRG